MARRQPLVRRLRGRGEGRDLLMTAPLVIGEEELDRALDVVEEAIAEETAAASRPLPA